ncbi:Wound-responsive family protein [Rhynchospora pubera]|uniref:Wound-responsive family protein n=1 Tax=Rhynchospora pubera TaxID=906938 RepID=A0AAV8D893_9POAL|nr:Wound-responsive family protein [Rhynchospora pubera]
MFNKLHQWIYILSLKIKKQTKQPLVYGTWNFQNQGPVFISPVTVHEPFHTLLISINKHHTLASPNQPQTHSHNKHQLQKTRESKTQMAPTERVSLIVAASVGAVEALKDQAGLCRWNYALRSAQSRLMQNMGAMSQVRKVSSGIGMEDKAKKSEESLRTVMYLSCWGPN